MLKIIVTLLIVILLGGCLKSETLKESKEDANIIHITNKGFNPNTLKIKAGETVTFTNKDKQLHWPASANHPAHTVYPEEGGCIGSKFDACVGLSSGKSYSFTFHKKGTWPYHDHLNSDMMGIIIVE